MKTEAARAAAAIRKELKKNGIKATVKSHNYSMGSSIRVVVNDQSPGTFDKIQNFANRFQYGHFDGMTDIYEYSNTNSDLNQAKFVFVDNKFSDEMKQAAFEFIKDTCALEEDFDQYQGNEYKLAFGNRNLGQFIYETLRGDKEFWTQSKKRVLA